MSTAFSESSESSGSSGSSASSGSPGFPDPRPVYARATEQAVALIKTVRQEQLTAPTPCSEFDVRALLSHVVGVTRRFAVVGEGGDGLALEPVAGDVADDAWAAAYDEARTRAIRAWSADERMRSPVRVPWGEVPGWQALSGYVMETVTHTWDLSEALGHPLELDDGLAGFALGVARRVLPEAERDASRPFAAAVEAPAGGGVYGELAAWLGRTPLAGR
jgi:uncharacterized protein (TIGR03086 family)